MKLFSKFQDYYDSTIGSFTESDVVVNRKQTTVEISYKDLESLGDFRGDWNYKKETNRGTTFCHQPIALVGFCGKWYFFKYTYPDTNNRDTIIPESIEYKTFDEIKENNNSNGILGKFKYEYKEPNNLWSELFEKYGPVLLIKRYDPPAMYEPAWSRTRKLQIEVWPELKQYKFPTVKDPYTAMWEIEHWYDSHARPDEAVVPVGDDVTRLQAYGFDKKTSFRKAKEKK